MTEPSNRLEIVPGIAVPLAEFEFTYARSGGPGGQNVNKVNSKAILRWAIVSSPSISDQVKRRFMEAFASRISSDGDLILSSQRFRDQVSNTNDCLAKLKEMLTSVASVPKWRRPTKPTAASKARRVTSKRENSLKKQQRRSTGES